MTDDCSSLPRRPFQIAVLGTGPIGRTVGRRWLQAGHSVAFGSRDPAKHAAFVAQLGPQASVHSWVGAVAAADIVLLAVDYDGAADVLAATGPHLAGKTLIDATNPMGVTETGSIISTLPAGITRGSHVAARLPDTRVIRAFTHVMEELLESRGRTQPMFWSMAIAGDDAASLAITSELVQDTGFTPVVIGNLASSGPLDPGGALFPHMFTAPDLNAALQ